MHLHYNLHLFIKLDNHVQKEKVSKEIQYQKLQNFTKYIVGAKSFSNQRFGNLLLGASLTQMHQESGMLRYKLIHRHFDTKQLIF